MERGEGMDTSTLDRFLLAQAHRYERALREIQGGKKRTHWMWYVFPQLRGLGKSPMAYTYGIEGAEEARAYLEHPLLSARLVEITEALLKHKDKDAYEIFGDVDERKLKSCMTLFAVAREGESVFRQALDCFFDGEMDECTLNLLGLSPQGKGSAKE